MSPDPILPCDLHSASKDLDLVGSLKCGWPSLRGDAESALQREMLRPWLFERAQLAMERQFCL